MGVPVLEGTWANHPSPPNRAHKQLGIPHDTTEAELHPGLGLPKPVLGVPEDRASHQTQGGAAEKNAFRPKQAGPSRRRGGTKA